ncbi:MAG: 4-hydroxy-tetrahydrodipicolinate synthase [Chromatiales bacterium]|nr:4-hydroxy-tetrahydrodipicolinate synthase [Chromatiales bacterium]
MYSGSFVALITPMHDDGSIDYSALARLVEFHVEQGSDGIVAVGTTGESATLDFDEHCQVIREVVSVAAGRVPVVAGTGANSTSEAIELTECAREAGADAMLSVVPYYNKPTQEGLYRHFRAIAGAVDAPLILYNVPGRTAVDMLPETVARLAQIDNIVGLKEASSDPARVPAVVARVDPGFMVMSGNDDMAREAIYAGATGVISVTANVAPRAMHEMCAAALAGQRNVADVIDARLAPLHAALFCESNPIPVKWAVHHMGLAGRGIRLPLTWLTESCEPKLRAALEASGVD